MRLARSDLLGRRVPVSAGAALEDIRDEDVGALSPMPTSSLVEELPGLTDERTPC